MNRLLAVIGVLSVALGISLTLNLLRTSAGTPPATSAPLRVGGENCENECDGGECVQGRCVRSGMCSRDSDCDDDNPCTAAWCIDGTCSGANRSGQCTFPGADAGQCEFGFCEQPQGAACLADTDCGTATNLCLERACIDGKCARGARTDGVECSTAIGKGGNCTGGACVVTADAGQRRCSTRWLPGVGWIPDCRRGLRFELEAGEVVKLEKDLEVRLANNLRYDMKAVLVGLHEGGYNIVLHNRRARSDVRGLCDPSFVAFDLADYTASTNWKSANLQVWLEPDREGWAVPTRGSRLAVDQGRANSMLGMYGVVDVRTFRTWLERAFRPLDPAPRQGAPQGGLELAHVVPALPPREDAGIDGGGAAADAGMAAVGASKPALSGKQTLARAWDAFGDGHLEEARRLLRLARGQGVRDAELEDLLSGE